MITSRGRYYDSPPEVLGSDLFQAGNLIAVKINSKVIFFDYSNDRRLVRPISSLPVNINSFWYDINIGKYRLSTGVSLKLWQSADGINWIEEDNETTMKLNIVCLPNGQYIGFTQGASQIGYAWISGDLVNWEQIPLPFQSQVMQKVIMRNGNDDEIIFLEGGWNSGMKKTALYSLSQQSVIQTISVQQTGRFYADYNNSIEKFNNWFIIVSNRIYAQGTPQKLWAVIPNMLPIELMTLPEFDGNVNSNVAVCIIQHEQKNKILVIHNLNTAQRAYLTDYQGGALQPLNISIKPATNNYLLKTDDAFIYIDNNNRVKKLAL